MKLIRKLVSVSLLIGLLSMNLGASAFAGGTVYENNDTTNNYAYNPERFLDTDPSLPPVKDTNPFGYTKQGTLSSVNDHDYYKLELPANTVFPGSTAIITLISPYQTEKYSIGINTLDGSYVQKQWLIDDEQVTQYLIHTQPNTIYTIHVYTSGETVTSNRYMLSVN